MSRGKLIADIRYFESEDPNIDGMLPNNVGKLLELPKLCALIGARIARKARELGFYTGGDFDHVYINFTTTAAPDSIQFSARSVDRNNKWLRFVDVGVNPAMVNKLSEIKQEAWLEATTLKVLHFLSEKLHVDSQVIDSLSKLLKHHGSSLPILHKVKATKSYRIAVTYLIAPEISKSTAWVEYTDLKSKITRHGPFIKLKFYEDLFFLVTDIAIQNGHIVFKPRSSLKAKLYNNRYKIPIQLNLEKIPVMHRDINS